MTRPSSNYDAQNYGHTYETMPEGVHQMGIISAQVTFSKDGAQQWAMELMPCVARYQSKFGLKLWLPCDGCVNALYDAGGADPRKVTDREYSPDEFIGKKVMVSVIHKTLDSGKVVANAKRLYPAFSLGKPAPAAPPHVREAARTAPAQADVYAHPFPDDADGVPF